MREELAKRLGQVGVFRGFVRDLTRNPQAIVIANVTDEYGTEVAEHLWFPMNKDFKQLKLTRRQQVEFDGVVAEYHKGPRAGIKDYCIKIIGKPRKVGKDSKSVSNRKR